MARWEPVPWPKGNTCATWARRACCADGAARWVEVCFCDVPLDEERPYWEQFFELVKVQDAHVRSRCRDLNGSEPWACCDCDCSGRLEARLQTQGEPLVDVLRSVTGALPPGDCR